MPQLNIIRASAGSGKTHFLTGSFLELLIKEPTDYFKCVLAVTFTNKATEEMKGRLIEELDVLSKDEQSDYLDQLMKMSGFDESHIRNKASAILQNILHDYSWLSVETIDSFFQRIIRAFTRELAIPGNYNIEIETTPVLQYAIDSLIDGIEENSELLNWLIQFSEAMIDEGKPWDIRHELMNLGREIFKEDFSTSSHLIYEAVSDKVEFEKFRNGLNAFVAKIEKQTVEYGKRGVGLIAEHGFEISDFYQGSRGVGAYFKKLSEGQVAEPNSYVVKMLDGPEFWPSGNTNRKQDVINVASDDLLLLLLQAIEYIHGNILHYNTIKEILHNLYALGILSDISNKITQYRFERNSFILSDSSVFIFRIIDNNDAPFIYEKMGNRYEHFMIDEFQDTSVLQWHNFKPLISNSLSSGYNCLLVGDVKQSIYRWRNSNWEVLADRVDNEYPKELIKPGRLETNWRSCERIINLNNHIFRHAPGILQDQINNKAGEMVGFNDENFYSFSKIYSDVIQSIPAKSRNKGSVHLQFFSKKDISENPGYCEEPLLKNIDELLRKGYSPGEIAILVRSKKEGQIIANLLIEQNAKGRFFRNLMVVTNESLFLSASGGVNLIIASLQYLMSPDDEINKGNLAIAYSALLTQKNKKTEILDLSFMLDSSSLSGLREILPKEFIDNRGALISLPLYDLVEHLIRIFNVDKLEDEVPYIHAFLDLVNDYTHTNPADIEKFLEYWNEEGINKSIAASESQDALRILTIHKSKGLQFRAVVIPFCDWEFDQKPGTILWTKSKNSDYHYLPLIPVNYKKNLLYTEFAGVYLAEMFKSYIDNLNLLYVAFTRAIETLVVFPVYRIPSKDNYSIVTVGDLLHEVFIRNDNTDFKKLYNAETGIYHAGEITEISKIPTDKCMEDEYIVSTTGSPASDRLFFNPLGFEYFSDLASGKESATMHGRVFHDILARVKTAKEVETAASDAVFKGLITVKDAKELTAHITQCFLDSKVSEWFDGIGEVLNETDILISEDKVRRPDRVIFYPDHVTVVDYKFGSEIKEDDHKAQVGEYVRLISKMGYDYVKRYIWYVNSNKVVEVTI
jgi:ATP-dependent exoDNAse (exonuclease V) beta subunit